MSSATGLWVWGIVCAAVWGAALVWLSVDIHRGKTGDDYGPYIGGGFMAGLFWPLLAVGGAVWVVLYLIHLGIGRFVPRPVPTAPVDPALEAARREVENIAPGDA